MRCFLGIMLTKNNLNTLSKEIIQIKAQCHSQQINWVQKKNYHITLSFLGIISEETIQKITHKLESLVFSAFEATTHSLKIFPNTHHPKILALTLPNKKITRLKILVDAFVNKDNRSTPSKFISHITLARFTTPLKINPDIETWPVANLSISIDHIALISSTLIPNGSLYSPLAITHLANRFKHKK